MSASREKKARQERGADYVSPKQLKELEEKKAARRATAIFTVCAVLFAAALAGMLLSNFGVLKRGAAAAKVNGESCTVSDVAYYYYNARSSILSDHSELDSATSLREQEYTESDEYDTWFDYAIDRALKSLAYVRQAGKAAQDAGFTGDGDVEQSVSETIASVKSGASNNGYSYGDYVKMIFGGLVTGSGLEKNLHNDALADAYMSLRSDPDGYTNAQLQAVYDADPTAYELVEYEAILFSSSDFIPEMDDAAEPDETDDGSAAALAAARTALARYHAGDSLESLASELNGSYMNTSAAYGSGSEIVEWLFNDARKSGDSSVVDYTYYGEPLGSAVVVFHSRGLADYHTVDVRHILVSDADTANSLLAQFRAGEQTEDAFAALARENSTDGGSSENGGLYTGVYKGQMVKPFEDWCFDESRKSGDTGIVETQYGYHIMYFVGRSEHAYWEELAASSLAGEWETKLSESVETELLDGMKYIDP